MFDWIFGSKKEEGKQPTKELGKEDKMDEGEKWVYDFICQYLGSPLWRNPLMDLFQEKCHIFEDTEENKFEYTKVFQEFVGLASLLLESMILQTGLTEQQFQKCLIRGLKSQRDHKLFRQVLVCDNFEVFKKIMVAQNKTMEVEAMNSLGATKSIHLKEQEKSQIQKAIALSLALQDKMSREEKDFEEAIRLSLAMDQQLRLSEKEEPKKEEVKKEEVKKEEVKKEEVKKEEVPLKKQEKKWMYQLPPLALGTEMKYDRSIEESRKEEKKVQMEIDKLQKEKFEEQGEELRKKRLMEQRELIRKKKQEQRKQELTSFVQNKQAVNALSESKPNEEEMQRRRNLMKRLKEQLKE